MSLRKLKRARKKTGKRIDPQAAEKTFAQGNAHKQAGRQAEAETCFRRAVRMNPGLGKAWNNLGNLLHDQGRSGDALPCYKRSCELMPDNPVCHYNLGSCLHESGNHAEGADALERAVNLAPDYREAYVSLGAAYQAMRDIDRAITVLRKFIHLNPDNGVGYRRLGLALKDSGRISEANEQLKLALRLNPHDCYTWYIITRYRKYASENDSDIQSMEQLLADETTGLDDAIYLHFGLGKIYDDLKMFDRAFSHFQKANSLKRKSLGKGWISTGIELDRIKKTFQSETFSRLASAGTRSELPVFIVGMPRSGTSLVEQICASHSQVLGRGELKDIRFIKDSLPGLTKNNKPYPECLQSVDVNLLRSLGGKYIEKIRNSLPGNITRVTDKMPSNFILLGLIKILFPEARIIHCVRDPKDTCLSNYFQYFMEGNESSYEFETLALYYRKYRELMEFWKTNLPGDIHDVRYEELVADPEKYSRRLIDFLGLEWEESCLSFFETKRVVQTASDYQVRQPMYSSSVGRWKNYEPFIGKLIEGLESKSRLV